MKRANFFALVVLAGSTVLCEPLLADDVVADDAVVEEAVAENAVAESVIVENRSEHLFYYSVRDRAGAAWSKSYELASGEKRSHVISNRLQISYLTDEAHFDWLDGTKIYRINDAQQGRLRPVTEVLRPPLPDATAESGNDRPATGDPATGDPATEDPATGSATTGDATTGDATTSDPATSDPADDPAATKPSAATGPAGKSADRDPNVEEPFDALFDVTNRVVTVTAIADNTYRGAFADWRERARRLVEGASAYYQREYSIRLVLTDARAWDYDGVADDLAARWERLLRESPKEVDLIVALVGYGDYSNVDGEAAFTGQLGRAAFFGQHLMVADRQDYHENRAKTILIHELGHVFGGFHVADQKLMMYPGYLQLPTDDIIAGTVPFGKIIDEVFSITKDFDFRAGVASLSPAKQRRIQALFRQHGLPNETIQTDPITYGYQYLQNRAEIVAEQMERRATASRELFDAVSD